MPFCDKCFYRTGTLIQVHSRQQTQMIADWKYICTSCFITEEHVKHSRVKEAPVKCLECK